MKKMLLALCGFAFALKAGAQDNPWQQQADYQMDVTMDVKTFRYKVPKNSRIQTTLPTLFAWYSTTSTTMLSNLIARWTATCKPSPTPIDVWLTT